MYTYKTHHPGHRLPWYVEMFIPKDKLVMHEETFNSHPCLLSTFTLPEFFGAKFCVTIKSKIVATKEELEEEENVEEEYTCLQVSNKVIAMSCYLKS